MKNNKRFQRVLAGSAVAMGMAVTPVVHAEDIDLYTISGAHSSIPNVLFVLDNSANWGANGGYAPCTYAGRLDGPGDDGRKVAIEKCALHDVITALKPANDTAPALVNIGFMLFNESPTSGGYPRSALLPLTFANAEALQEKIRGFNRTGDNTNNASFAQTMYESYLYFKGRDVYNGKATANKFDGRAFDGNRYNSPLENDCQKNYLILIANGSEEASTASTDAVLLQGLGGDATPITYPSSASISNNDQKSLADEYARFLSRTDLSSTGAMQNIITHTIAVTGASSDGNYPNFYAGVAAAGGGKFFKASDAAQLKTALLNLMNEIQAVNSVFASSSLPVSVNAQGTYLNQIFMGMFRPDASAAPRWFGNLKQYRFCVNSLNKLYLADSTNQADGSCTPAVNSGNGFITPTATSYWSTASNYWNFGAYTAGSASDAPDGDVVEKGGAAQWQRTALTPATRKLYTHRCSTAGCTAGVLSEYPFNTTTIDPDIATNQAAFNVTNSTDLTNLINWVRGANNKNENPNIPSTSMRPSVHGDVLHSRPVVVNYGGTNGIVAFYGANDGVLRAVDASRTSATAGNELWGFVPPEFYGKLRRLEQNTPELRFPTTPSSIAAEPKDYFFDGPIGVYQKLNDTTGATEKVHLYVGMRRGGRFIYALDVTAKDNPQFLWKKGCFNGSTCDVGYEALGQTWSEPKVTRIRGNANPVLIFGGGYDRAEDTEPAGTTTMGNAVFVVDAITGNTIRVFRDAGMTKSFPADVTLMDRDFDGYTDRVYAADAGANIWRLDIDAVSPDSWTVNKFATLSTPLNERKIFFPVDVVATNNFDAIMIGTGDREHPLATNAASSVLNRFYMLKDNDIGKTVSSTFSTIVDADVDSGAELFNATSAEYDNSRRGWFVNLAAGEKVVNAPVTIGGFVNFGTNKPTANLPGQCSNLGIAQGYSIDFIGGNPTKPVIFTGGGLPPSPVAGIVEIVDASGKVTKRPFIIGGGDPQGPGNSGEQVQKSAIEVQDPLIKTPKTRRRTYSYKKFD
jgi:type IV pilus assembly protein PilY1